MRPKKFNFNKILMNGGGPSKDTQPTVSITRGGQMIISKSANHLYGFSEVMVDILWDAEKRALGIRKIRGLLPENEWTKTMRLVKQDKKGMVRVPIGRIMTKLEIEKRSYNSLPLELYRDLMEDSDIYYVELPKSL